MNTGTSIDLRNTNSLWCSVLAETLHRLGVRRAVTSPGSRSTPLTMALARHPAIEAIPVLDERSAAFFALGLAKRDLRPVVLVCTSGTAAANFFPAVIEARESGVPLIIITADRPPEMRACASGQTIDQQKIYGDYVNFYHELAVPEATEARLRYLRQTVAHAHVRTLRPNAGPVHLNAPFRDPLPPVEDGTAQGWAAGFDWEMFFGQLAEPGDEVVHTSVPPLASDGHGVIVVGAAQPADVDAYVEAVGEIARRLGWPVLADGLSPLRHHASRVPGLVTTYAGILRNPAAAERLRPERVLCLEGWPTSRVLQGWLETCAAPTLLISERVDNRDALHGRTTQRRISLRAFAEQLPLATEANGYERMWAAFERKARTVLDARLTVTTELFEPKAAWLLAQHLPEDTQLSIANSMPVRDVEYVWPAGDRRIRPLFNRGANGIDGTLSTALGVAHEAGQPAVLLTGDLALLHDTNGFLLRPKLVGSLTVVLINNRGGGIFEHLPVAQFDPPFEEFFATPQEADFAKLAEAYGAEHLVVRDWEHFIALVSELPASGIRVLELRTDRKRDTAGRQQLFAAVAAAAE
ncbi:MAG: 2-succinyl-5-enolpyruvyl-6-hydroxy-3-cyclohexene-1-carboxylic-acid synthase [Opitutus sp.]|nr:2-succinyl-5-enolpyruvyl-6-hydroxy-3-cyclohexene-1-carboxylic-acid synthase [Opitutus sp.]